MVLANEIAAQVVASPSTFGQVARARSEDVATRANGGLLGGVRPTELLMDAALLDALAALRPGEVSRPVETRHGFHILIRRSPPSLFSLAARRLVIPYVGAPVAGSPQAQPMGRTPAAAEKLADDVAGSLRRDDSLFDNYLREYPSPSTADAAGFIGVWTSQEPGPLERERELLSALAVGGVAEPINSPDGYEVLQRLPVDTPTYVLELVKFAYRPSLPSSDPYSHESALQQAHDLLSRVANDPSAFADYQRKYCCPGVEGPHPSTA